MAMPSTRWRWRRDGGHLLGVLIPLLAAPVPAAAQDALYIRIRPLPDAEAARAAREMLWARRQAHARAIIESVCTGCLGAWASEAVPPRAPPPAEHIANLAVPIGVELDPGSGASDQQSDPSTSERHP